MQPSKTGCNKIPYPIKANLGWLQYVGKFVSESGKPQKFHTYKFMLQDVTRLVWSWYCGHRQDMENWIPACSQTCPRIIDFAQLKSLDNMTCMDGAVLRKVFVKKNIRNAWNLLQHWKLFVCARASGREARLEENRAAQGPKGETPERKTTDFRVFHWNTKGDCAVIMMTNTTRAPAPSSKIIGITAITAISTYLQ